MGTVSLTGPTGCDGKESTMYYWALRKFVHELNKRFLMRGTKETNGMFKAVPQTEQQDGATFVRSCEKRAVEAKKITAKEKPSEAKQPSSPQGGGTSEPSQKQVKYQKRVAALAEAKGGAGCHGNMQVPPPSDYSPKDKKPCDYCNGGYRMPIREGRTIAGWPATAPGAQMTTLSHGSTLRAQRCGRMRK
ncbi:hypothetical protein CYMTET_51192 [Cymbomonas tetramitiformis]|uniref:Uncharacterized protein n=1 Tax=Cymbomonas tetramitiformis TaxID=36881 RepID=A0AAE0ESE5_9CHLO|nr:hypothetical protein CYMTET_51192 [Cymbomonas tetramitiformis]